MKFQLIGICEICKKTHKYNIFSEELRIFFTSYLRPTSREIKRCICLSCGERIYKEIPNASIRMSKVSIHLVLEEDKTNYIWP